LCTKYNHVTTPFLFLTETALSSLRLLLHDVIAAKCDVIIAAKRYGVIIAAKHYDVIIAATTAPALCHRCKALWRHH
jgi:hypothetical protein